MAILANALKFGSYFKPKPGRTLIPADWTVAASTTIKAKDYVKLSSGKLVPAITPSGSINTAVLISASQVLVGVAINAIVTDSGGIATDGTGRTQTQILLIEDIQAMHGIYNATASAAQQQDIVRGSFYDLAVVTGAAITQWAYMVATSTTSATQAMCCYREPSPESATDENYGWIWVDFIATARLGA
jgi:hypothetical protein